MPEHRDEETGSTADRPLAHLRVLDLTRLFPGAFCTAMLADLGADVLRIEPPDGNDPVRTMPGGLAAYQRGKRSLALDLRHPDAPDVVRRLVGRVDVVVVESSVPRALAEAGIAYESAAADHPAIVWCSMPAFGRGSPYASRAGHDIAFLGYAGLLDLVAGGSVPGTPDYVLASPLAALVACVGILSAIAERDRSGRGRLVEASLVDSARWVIGEAAARVAAGERAGWGDAASRRAYRAGDGKLVTLSAAEPRTWAAFCAGIERPDLEPLLYADASGQEALRDVLAATFATRPAAEWVAHFASSPAAVGPVLSVDEVLEDEDVLARRSLVDLSGGSGDPQRALRNPLRSYDPEGVELEPGLGPPPHLGEHTIPVLTDAGFTPDEIDALREAGAIGTD